MFCLRLDSEYAVALGFPARWPVFDIFKGVVSVSEPLGVQLITFTRPPTDNFAQLELQQRSRTGIARLALVDGMAHIRQYKSSDFDDAAHIVSPYLSGGRPWHCKADGPSAGRRYHHHLLGPRSHRDWHHTCGRTNTLTSRRKHASSSTTAPARR
jgi:hypothetical protein